MLTHRIFSYSVLFILAFSQISSEAWAKKTKKKLSLSELAALEWKLEQAATHLTTKANATDRQKALQTLEKIDDPRAISPLIRALKDDPDENIRHRALKRVSTYKTPEVKGALQIAQHADPSVKIRKLAKTLLKRFPRGMKPAKISLKVPTFTPPKQKNAKAIQQALTLPSSGARIWAIETIAKQNTNDKRIEQALINDPSAKVRIRSIQLLAQSKKKALQTLIKAMNDGDPSVRFEVARVLSNIDDPAVLKVLQRVAKSDSNPDVRAEVKDLLEPSTIIGQRLLKDDIKKLESANPAERIKALGALSRFTDWRAMTPMACTLLRDKSLAVRNKAADTLSKTHDASVLTALRVAAMIEANPQQKNRVRKTLGGLVKRVNALIKELSAKSPQMRAKAARLLGQAAYPQALKPLLKAANDKNAKVRYEVIHALSNFSKGEAKKAIAKAAADSDQRIKRYASNYSKDDKIFTQHRKFYRDPNRMIAKLYDKNTVWRMDAAIALGVMANERAVIRLAHLLKNDPDVNVRLASAWSIVLMGNPKGLKALKQAAAEDKSEKVRLTARKYLIISKVSIEDLLQHLNDTKEENRVDGAEALSLRISGRAIYDLIKSAMCDPSAKVRQAALRGLARTGKPFARDVLRSIMHRDSDGSVRRTALMMYILAGGK